MLSSSDSAGILQRRPVPAVQQLVLAGDKQIKRDFWKQSQGARLLLSGKADSG